MERAKDFDSFYEAQLKPDIEALQQQNKKADYWGIAIMLAAFALIPVLIYGLQDASGALGKAMVALMVLLLGFTAHNYAKVSGSFETRFKEQIIRKIIHFIEPGLTYKPGSFMSSSYFSRSGLFAGTYNIYDGDDLIEGTYKSVFFKCSEMNVVERGYRGRIKNIFKGLFFAAPVNKNYQYGTYVYRTDEEENLPAYYMDQLVRLDCSDGNFENYYSVFTTNTAEASGIVDAEMMQRIINFAAQIRRNVRFSVVAGMCYVAIPFSQELLEPPGPYDDEKEEVKEYFFTVLLILSIINQLKIEKLL